MNIPLFTVFTPTRNRAHTLPRVYDSLRAQTFRDFEWLIVDDGSTDGTAELVQQWSTEAEFPVRYILQSHGGKARATNNGVREAQGQLFLNLDSDDHAHPVALERFAYHWDSIPPDQRHLYAGVTCLLEDEDGRLCSDPLPLPTIDSNYIEMRDRYRVVGEKWGFLRTDVLREHPYPEIEGETFVMEGIVWAQIALNYRTRYVHEVLGVYNHEPDSIRTLSPRVRNPRGAALYYREMANCSYPLSGLFRMRSYANYIRYSLHAGMGATDQVREVSSQAMWLLSAPVAIVLFGRDKHRQRQRSAGIGDV